MQEYCSNLTVNGKTFSFYDLEKAAKSHDVKVGELPYTIRILHVVIFFTIEKAPCFILKTKQGAFCHLQRSTYFNRFNQKTPFSDQPKRPASTRLLPTGNNSPVCGTI